MNILTVIYIAVLKGLIPRFLKDYILQLNCYFPPTNKEDAWIKSHIEITLVQPKINVFLLI